MGCSTPNWGCICSHDPNGHIPLKKPTGALYRERSTTGAAPIFAKNRLQKNPKNRKRQFLTPNCGYICSHDPNGYISAKKPTGALYRERSTTGDAPISTGAAPRAAIFG